MTRTVVALYDNFSSANDAVRDLVDHGFSRDDISLMASDAAGEYGTYLDRDRAMETDVETTGASEGAGVGAGIGAVLGGLGGLLVGLGALTIPGIGPIIAAGPLAAALTGLAGAGVGAVAGGVTGGLIGALVDMGVPEETAGYYAEGVRRGGTLVTVRTSDDMTDRAVDILNNHNPVDINERATQWRETGWTSFDPNAETYPTGTTDMDRERYTRGTVGTAGTHTTQDIDTGAQEAHPRRTEVREGEEQLWPRDQYRESDEVAGTETERQLWQGGTDVDAESRYRDFTEYDPDFRRHYETSMTGTGYTYDQYQPAYRYGYDLAVDTRYREYDWDRLEPEARSYWEERNPGTWERFKSAVRHAWEEIKDAVD
jgi:hypothetical protein